MSVNTEERSPLLQNEHKFIPFRFQNKYLIFVCLGISFIGCVIASGPLAAVPTIEELLVQVQKVYVEFNNI